MLLVEIEENVFLAKTLCFCWIGWKHFSGKLLKLSAFVALIATLKNFTAFPYFRKPSRQGVFCVRGSERVCLQRQKVETIKNFTSTKVLLSIWKWWLWVLNLKQVVEEKKFCFFRKQIQNNHGRSLFPKSIKNVF